MGRIVPSWVWHLSGSWRPFLRVDTLCQFIFCESFVSHFILHDSKEKEVKFSTWRIYSCHQCLKCLTRSSVNFFMWVCLNVLWTDHYISWDMRSVKYLLRLGNFIYSCHVILPFIFVYFWHRKCFKQKKWQYSQKTEISL